MGTSREQTAGERARAAAERGELAGQRVADLRSRRQSLDDGQRSSAWTSDAARTAYEQSLLLAAAARRCALDAFRNAADAHRAAALGAERCGDLARAQQHLDLAAADDLRAVSLAQTDA